MEGNDPRSVCLLADCVELKSKGKYGPGSLITYSNAVTVKDVRRKSEVSCRRGNAKSTWQHEA